MALTRAVMVADVTHARLLPRKNQFRYRVYYLTVALSALRELTRLTLFSLDRFNLFSLRTAQYGDGTQPPEAWARSVLAEWNITTADGEIVLVTMPRLFGLTFNPVSFWFCLDAQGALRAVISEVTNTFHDRHCYLSFKDDQSIIGQDDVLRAEKIFHVSPFLTVEGEYRFRFVYRAERIGVWIDHYTADGLVLATSVTGKRKAASSARLLYCMLRYPFPVLGLIHYQALKLYLKNIRYHRRPEPPTTKVSR